MHESIRACIKEPMTDQRVTIQKAGKAQLSARCSLIAAANTIAGIYDSKIGLSKNICFGDFLHQFDIVCVIKDDLGSDSDEEMATFIINSHMKSHPMQKKLEKN